MAGYQAPAERIEPVAPSPSLLTSAKNRTGDGFGVPGKRWSSGIKWNPASCSPSDRFPIVKAAVGSASKGTGSLSGLVAVDPFTIYTPIACDWTTMASEGALDGASEALNDAHTAYRLARALWLGEGLAAYSVDGFDSAVVNPTLRSEAVDISVGTAKQSPADAIVELLSAWTECTGGSGGAVIHVPDVALGPLISGSNGLVEVQGNRMVVPEWGATVTHGPGYPNGPSTISTAGAYGPEIGSTSTYLGNANDEVWMYVTGPVEYALTPNRLVKPNGEETDRSTDYARANKYEVMAEREALIRFDNCCVLAQLTSIPMGAIS